LQLEETEVEEFRIEDSGLFVHEGILFQQFFFRFRYFVDPCECLLIRLEGHAHFDNQVEEQITLNLLEIVYCSLQFQQDHSHHKRTVVGPLGFKSLELVTIELFRHFSDKISFFERNLFKFVFQS